MKEMNWKKSVIAFATLGFLGTTLALSSVSSANTQSGGPVIPLGGKPREPVRIPNKFEFSELKPDRLPPVNPKTVENSQRLPKIDWRVGQSETSTWVAWDWMKQELAASAELDGNGVTRDVYAGIYTTAWSMAGSDAERAAIYATAWNDWNTIR